MNSGFSLLEILFALGTFTLIIGVITLFSRNIWIYNSFLKNSLDNLSFGRQIIRTMATEIRTASIAETGAYTISQASDTSFTFYTNIDNDRQKERIRYFLENGSLKKGVIQPSGSPLGYDSGSETVSTLVDNVTNTPIFNFYDDSYDGTSAALSSPINISEIRLVKITVVIEKDPNRPPGPATFTTQVSMRNLKDNL